MRPYVNVTRNTNGGFQDIQGPTSTKQNRNQNGCWKHLRNLVNGGILGYFDSSIHFSYITMPQYSVTEWK